ncbi:MAG: hypothetical protein ABI835_01865 [Chloroflexota bacterium]
MESQIVIMVQVAATAWTREALHCACVMARQQSARIVLMKFVPVQHLSWLGTDLTQQSLSDREQQELADYQTTLEDYGVDFCTQFFQFATLAEAVAQAAEYVAAQVVFAMLPKSVIPFWRSYQLRSLQHSLALSGCAFIENPTYVQAMPPLTEAPSIQVRTQTSG